jgi:hypothetical protein
MRTRDWKSPNAPNAPNCDLQLVIKCACGGNFDTLPMNAVISTVRDCKSDAQVMICNSCQKQAIMKVTNDDASS